ncbi:tRNA pseudouridine(38-40) synthase TruA [Methylophilaceae bacterium]|jgi:tRNA pseudouridine38-40 synthase|nr:tRNA pseudouridine(38-40) synthase TruA [Methylophilaceae bacterium]|tara:strand:+ start:529 stop:1320 length:792 start_codon:yes stop_codon:yes gene_type:complete
MRYAASVEYDGTNFFGWQRQSSVNSIQEELEISLSKITQSNIKIQGSGRTDARVHALGQVFHFDTDIIRPIKSLTKGVNSFLPDSIRIKWVKEVPDDFHARFSATSREYQYLLNNNSINSSIWSNYCGWTFYELDFNLLIIASKKFIGSHDFTAFRSSECQAKSPIRSIKNITVEKFDNFYLFTINGDGFLHHQIRNMIAAIINVARQEMSVDYIDTLFEKKDRSLAPATFSPNGLYLTNIKYDKIWNLPDKLNTLNIFKVQS